MSSNSILLYFLVDIAIVVAISAFLGSLARRVREPTVIGQILAGIALGPSLLGRLPGNLEKHLFPASVVPYLTQFSQVAVVIFMFVVGYEIDLTRIRALTRIVPAIALAAFAVPFALGAGLAWAFLQGSATFGPHASGAAFILFMGVATSITALPVLAAIAKERGIAESRAGVIAITAAGIMDVVAWVVLAAAVAGTKSASGRAWPLTLLLILAFAVFMLVTVRWLLNWWFARARLTLASRVSIALALAVGSAWVTASLGVHPVFGGFLAGLAMRGRGRGPDTEVLRFMESGGGLLLPLFFVITGLSVVVATLRGSDLILLAGLCLIAAAGKFVPAYAASRLTGLERRQSATVAALVNTRGLTELIALGVGLQAGLIGSRLFTILVLMALVTTMMTGPLLTLIQPLPISAESAEAETADKPPEAEPANLHGP